MGRPIKLVESSTQDTAYASGIGGVIGEPSSVTSINTINFTYADSVGNDITNGFAYKQRGKARFDVSNASAPWTGNTTITLVNSTDGNVANLAANTGFVLCYNTSNTAFYAQYITSHHVWDWSNNKYAYVSAPKSASATYANVATN